MTVKISENIIVALSITYILPTYFKDKFFENIQAIFVWNKDMNYVLMLLWVLCLDGTIYIWTKIFT